MMRMVKPAMLAVAVAMVSGAVAKADWVPPVKGNDTGGIISTGLIGIADVDAIAVQHCAQYGKVAKKLGAPRTYGMYLSFACVWVPPGGYDRPLSVRY